MEILASRKHEVLLNALKNIQQIGTLTMADPFEVRMRFTHQLQHLNASINSSQKAAHYALKYRDMDEDLHSCILEQLERVCALYQTLARPFLLRLKPLSRTR